MRIAVIPARGGSRRIPQKNVRMFAGRPIVAWPIGVALSCGLFDHVIVSTDDVEVAEVARSHGAQVPFMRPAELATDTATTDAALLHALRQCSAMYGDISHVCCIYPTAVLLDGGDLRRGLALLEEHKAATSFPVVPYDFPIEQAFELDGVRLRARWPDALDRNSQDLPVHYHDAGSFYWADAARFLRDPRLLVADNVSFVIPSWRVQDINTVDDWNNAELKFELLRARGQTS